jgi:dTMP kinase
MRSSGRLIIFEGMDGCGKSALSKALTRVLAKQGSTARLVTFPGRIPGTLGQLVYTIHHDANSKGIDRLSPSSLQALHIAAHLDAIDTVILPTLARGEDVVLDRYWWSTLAYGIAAGAPRGILQALVAVERLAWGVHHPTCLFYVRREIPSSRLSRDRRSLEVAYEEIIAAEAGKYLIQQIENRTTLKASLEQVTSFVLSSLR